MPKIKKIFDNKHYPTLLSAVESIKECAKNNDVVVEDVFEDYGAYGDDFQQVSAALLEGYALGRNIDIKDLYEAIEKKSKA